ncbi:RagB/SusD family nutrient uptake outer membrane protein [Flammeovirga sp. EKP202]|uniref:RagB/SusD family nutrient uptake outer membrane protein n=1 Tax=Flammeovirga sp. EKP202 TaxID=2770592 RepID=UPI00165EC17F|nr:RagB/SusD family nutrient uptake outer membrane protein [Flammeovirga sp. EKP202]MBD0400600.1 RagB/SusD family nutrient uptake outer membrane protein [Flammeovirga sp. EKP202]
MKLYQFILLFGLGMLTSCESFLKEIPKDRFIDENLLQSDSDLDAATAGLYNSFVKENGLYSHWLYYIDNGTDDNVTHYTRANLEADDISAHEVVANNQTIEFIWTLFWEAINRSNSLIHSINELNDPSISESAKITNIGESRLIRALCYFHLVRLFGPVPVIDQAITDRSQAYAGPRVNVDSIYQNVIIPDLQYAENFARDFKAGQRGRLNKWAAKLILSKVYLTMAGYQYEPSTGTWFTLEDSRRQEYYKLARDKAEEIILNSPFRLETQSQNDKTPAYGWVFDDDNHGNMESIWTIYFHNAEDFKGAGLASRLSRLHMARKNDFWNGSTNSGNMIKEESPDLAENYILPTPDLFKSFEPNDTRKSWGMLTNFTSGEGVMYGFSPSNAKYIDPTLHIHGENGNRSGVGNKNLIVYRIADAFLVYAEAANELEGETPTLAYSYLNLIRNRAGLKAIFPGLSKDEFRTVIRKERRMELFGELNRRYDLNRWNNFEEKYSNMITIYEPSDNIEGEIKDVIEYMPKHTGSMNSMYRVFPIPYIVINRNAEVTQNYGY